MDDDLPELTPAETLRVRRLLSEARHTEPMPADVTARLDRTLATLAGEQRTLQDRTVVSLTSRRRRRATRFLVAAVAVVVVGIGVGQVVSGTDPAMNAGSRGDSASSADESYADGQTAEEAAPQPPPGTAPQEGDSASSLPRVEDDTFDADAATARALGAKADASAPSAPSAETPSDSQSDSQSAGACDRVAWGEGERVQVLYQDMRAALVFRPPIDGTQVVDVFACDGVVVLRTTRVPAP